MTTNAMKTTILRGTLLAALTMAAACGTKDATGPLAPSGAQGRVRFVNVITDTTRGRVNAILENVPFGVNLTYTQSTPITLAAPSTANYAAILAGQRTLVLKRTADTNNVVATIPFAVSPNADYTVYATGGRSGAAVTPYITSDDNSAPAAGQAKVRVVHLSPTAGAVDVFVTAVGANLATATPVLTNVANGSASTYLALPAGTYEVRTVPAGTAPASRAGAVNITASLVLAAGNVRTVVAADNNVGGAPLRAFVLVDR